MDTHIIAEWFATARQILKMCLFSVFYQLLGLVKGLLCFDSILIEARSFTMGLLTSISRRNTWPANDWLLAGVLDGIYLGLITLIIIILALNLVNRGWVNGPTAYSWFYVINVNIGYFAVILLMLDFRLNLFLLILLYYTNKTILAGLFVEYSSIHYFDPIVDLFNRQGAGFGAVPLMQPIENPDDDSDDEVDHVFQGQIKSFAYFTPLAQTINLHHVDWNDLSLGEKISLLANVSSLPFRSMELLQEFLNSGLVLCYFIEAVDFDYEELIHNDGLNIRQDVRPDLNSAGPLKHREPGIIKYHEYTLKLKRTVVSSLWDVIVGRISLYDYIIEGSIELELSQPRELFVSNELVANNTTLRTINTSTSDANAKIAIQSSVRNSTTVNINRYHILDNRFIYDDSATLMFHLYRYRFETISRRDMHF